MNPMQRDVLLAGAILLAATVRGFYSEAHPVADSPLTVGIGLVVLGMLYLAYLLLPSTRARRLRALEPRPTWLTWLAGVLVLGGVLLQWWSVEASNFLGTAGMAVLLLNAWTHATHHPETASR